jgi:hypothetical protein
MKNPLNGIAKFHSYINYDLDKAGELEKAVYKNIPIKFLDEFRIACRLIYRKSIFARFRGPRAKVGRRGINAKAHCLKRHAVTFSAYFKDGA